MDYAGDFGGKVAWITGASSGIGAALARELAARGAHLILSGRDEARLAQVAQDVAQEAAQDCDEALIIAFDVRDDAALADATAKAIAWKGGVDIAFANAGVSQRSRALKTDMQVYRDIIEIDLTAQIAFSQGLIGHMVERGSGALGFISSIAGKVGVPMRTAYCAAKFGLAGYGDALRAELSQTGVSVHVIYPGSVATNVSRNALVGDGRARGVSDKAIDEGIPADVAARAMLDGMAAGNREIIIAEGAELAIGEARRTPDALLDQVAGMVAKGYMEKMEGEAQ
ncbi:MAG: SDR family NAD(P)-dependent oxidoreductase [Erythrobacter sp.]